jgi:hypothetical protein
MTGRLLRAVAGWLLVSGALAGLWMSLLTDVASGARVHGSQLSRDRAPGLVALKDAAIPAIGPALARGAIVPVPATREDSRRPLELTFTLRRSDEPGFRRLVRAVTDPRSRQYRHFLSQRVLTSRFGPARASYRAVLTWLRRSGFRHVHGSANRLTITATAARVDVERALHTTFSDFSRAGRRVFANTAGVYLPRALARDVEDVAGLSDLATPVRETESAQRPVATRSHAATGIAPLASPLYNVSQQETNDCYSWASGAAFGTGLIGATVATFQNVIWKLSTLAEYLSGPGAVYFAALAGAPAVYCFAAGAASGFRQSLGVPPLAGSCDQSYRDLHGLPPCPPVEARPRQRAPSHVRAGTGSGGRVGLVEFDSFHQSDVADWLNLSGSSTLKSHLRQVTAIPVNGGVPAPGAGESEVLLDVDGAAFLTSVPISVYEAPANTSFQQMFNTMIGDGDTVISNSWSECEGEVSQADAQSIDSVLAQATASGISVFNASGDTGSTCLDGSANRIGVPADSPHATAVGATSLTFGPGFARGQETRWGGSSATEGSGYGTSIYFPRPAYQNGLSSSPMRSVPDLSTVADPADGMELCQADRGGCPESELYGGTSLAAPVMAALTADLNLQIGSNLGDANAALYPLAGTSSFHSPASLSSDFAHVGLGSPVFDGIELALRHETVGPASATASVAASVSPVAADGSSHGEVRVALVDAHGFPVAGAHVTVSADSPNAMVTPLAGADTDAGGTAGFSVSDPQKETVTLTATDTTDGVVLTSHPTLDFVGPIASGATIVASPTTVVNDGASTATITVYLQNTLGQPASGKTVSLAAGGGSAAIGPASHQAVTGDDGVATFTATDTASESVLFTATDTTDGNLPVPGSGTVNFQPAGAPTCVDTPPTPAAGSGLSVSTFVDGVPNNDHPLVSVFGGITFTSPACVGVETPAFDASGNVFLASPIGAQVYEFGPAGGTAGQGSALPGSAFAPGELVGGLAFGKTGRLYASIYTGGDLTKPTIAEIDPATGAVKRVVATRASGLPFFPVYIAVDPISGDVFSVDDGSGAGTGNDNVTRIADPESATPAVGPYANVGGVQTGLTFAPDGTMYVAVVTGPNTNAIMSVTGTSSASPGTVTKVATLPNPPFGVGVADSDTSGHATALIVVESGGNIDRIDLTSNPATSTTIASRPTAFSTGGAIGPDGCLYYDDQDKLLKVTGVSSACAGAPANPGPHITLDTTGPPRPATGSGVGFTAHLAGVPSPQGTPVHFVVSGANTRQTLVDADGAGAAAMTYSGTFAGADAVTALAVVGGKTITSAPIRLRWVAGKHTTFLTLNGAQQSGIPGQPATFKASLTDVSQTPPAPVAGAAIPVTVGGGTCVVTTNAAGAGACTLTPAGGLGLQTVTATYAGDATRTPSTASDYFAAGGVGSTAPPPPPPPPAAVPPPAGPPPAAPPPPPAQPAAPQQSPALACTGAKIVLINVFRRGARVVITGAARLSLAGQRVQIRLVGTKKMLAGVTISRDGTFATTAPLPARKIRNTNKASYEAFAAGSHSGALKLTRRLVVTQSVERAGRIHLAGSVGRPLIKGAKLTIKARATCHAYRTVATVAIARSGSWSASLPAPRQRTVYRAQATIRSGRRRLTTYSLPLPAPTA